jgi:hypothetical protein
MDFLLLACMLHAQISSPHLLTINFQNKTNLSSVAIPHNELHLIVDIRYEMAVWAFLADFTKEFDYTLLH